MWGRSELDGISMATAGRRKRRLWDAYAFPGFRPETTVRGIFGDPKARIVRLKRRSKKRAAPTAVVCIAAGTIARFGACAICPAATRASILRSRSGASVAERAAR